MLYVGTQDNHLFTIKGSVRFHVDLVNEGVLLVDADTDTMEIGYMDTEQPLIHVAGSAGQFKATAGRLRFGWTKIDSALGRMLCKWHIYGGTIEQTQHAQHTTWLNGMHPVEVRSGTLKLGWFFVTRGGLEYSGGRIEVVLPYTVMFERWRQND